MFKMHQLEKLSFWFGKDGKRSCYSLTYNEKDKILHVFNHAFPNTYSLYNALTSDPSHFIGKIRNQMKFALRSELPANTRIFFYDRSKIVYEWMVDEKKINPLVEEEWYLLYTPYLKPLPSPTQKGRVIIE
jgi:hypothetical protein